MMTPAEKKRKAKEKQRKKSIEKVVAAVENGATLRDALIGNISNSMFYATIKNYPELHERYRATDRTLIMPTRVDKIYCDCCGVEIWDSKLTAEDYVDGELDILIFCSEDCWEEYSPSTFREAAE